MLSGDYFLMPPFSLSGRGNSRREIDVPGIIVRGPDGRLSRVVEASDATPDELAIRERNTGVYLVGRDLLWKCLAQVDSDNSQGEIYLTAIVEILLAEGPEPPRARMRSTMDAVECTQ